MKTQKSKLVFGKSSITELNDQQIKSVMGGTTYVCSNCNPDPVSEAITAALSLNNQGQMAQEVGGIRDISN